MQRWFRVLADTEEAAQMTARDMQAHLTEQGWLESLTANPLLLTAMCIIYDEGKRLPQDKHDLYDRIIDTVLHGRYREPVAKDAARNRLGVIALGMHTGEGLREVRSTPQAEATYAEIERMLKIYQDRSSWTEEGYLGAVETREDLLSNSGLLLSSGEKRARFYHLSFQEFLAAQRILDLADRSLLDVFRERAAAPEWRNTLSMLFGRVLGTSVSPERGISLMRDMIDAIARRQSTSRWWWPIASRPYWQKVFGWQRTRDLDSNRSFCGRCAATRWRAIARVSATRWRASAIRASMLMPGTCQTSRSWVSSRSPRGLS